MLVNSPGSCPQSSLVEYIIDKLRKTLTGMLTASELGIDVNRRPAWASEIKQAGGKLKLFCLDHPDKSYQMDQLRDRASPAHQDRLNTNLGHGDDHDRGPKLGEGSLLERGYCAIVHWINVLC